MGRGGRLERQNWWENDNMAYFSEISQTRLETCHKDLQTLFNHIIQSYDCSILCGHRDEIDQNKAYREGKSKLKFPRSLHNLVPSRAIDVAPYPIDWQNIIRFYAFGGYVLGVAQHLRSTREITHNLRWGGDWRGNRVYNDQKFIDLPHFELVLEE